jgi:hypothetical protein
MRHQPDARANILARIRDVRASALEISKLLGDDALVGSEWDRAAGILARCREERRVLDRELRRLGD